MIFNTIKCTEQDGMSEKDFIAAITLLGAIENPASKNYFILAKVDEFGSSHGHTVDVNALSMNYKNMTYPLGEYKRLLYRIIYDMKIIRKFTL